jgi:hypothetical protein
MEGQNGGQPEFKYAGKACTSGGSDMNVLLVKVMSAMSDAKNLKGRPAGYQFMIVVEL